jgi:hypothetical protein
MKPILAAIALLIHASEAHAFSSYKCIVKHGYKLEGDHIAPSDFGQLSVNQEFVVDRATGRMFGRGTMSSAGWLGRNEVLDAGSEAQSFKALYRSPGPAFHVRLLIIREFDRGPIKGFIFIDSTDVYTGSCTHLD